MRKALGETALRVGWGRVGSVPSVLEDPPQGHGTKRRGRAGLRSLGFAFAWLGLFRALALLTLPRPLRHSVQTSWSLPMTCFRSQCQDGTQSLPQRKEVPRGDRALLGADDRVPGGIWDVPQRHGESFGQDLERILQSREVQEVRKCPCESILRYSLDMNCLLTCIFGLLIYVLLYTFVARTIPTYASDIILYAFSPSFNIFLPTAVRRLQEQGTSALTFVL